MALISRTTSSRKLAAYWSTVICVYSLLHQLAKVCCTVQELLLSRSGSLSRKTIGVYGYNGLVDIRTGILIGGKKFSLTNPSLICSTMVATFVSEALSVSTTFRNAILDTILDEHLESWSEVLLHIVRYSIAMNCG
ncbi:hypothetical protein TNCV_4017891 [Trichonephila clavipes]|nr:hypothetical protein TNCV_4017891 [Trichonephila clavipes]